MFPVKRRMVARGLVSVNRPGRPVPQQFCWIEPASLCITLGALRVLRGKTNTGTAKNAKKAQSFAKATFCASEENAGVYSNSLKAGMRAPLVVFPT
jgi:hypothetical protein